jgi:hypothetical protein
MKTDNYNRFDELIRQKLDSYETEPDMDLLVTIQARKSRFLRSRNLLTIIGMLALLMAGILGGYLLSKSKRENSSVPYRIEDSNQTSSDVSVSLNARNSAETGANAFSIFNSFNQLYPHQVYQTQGYQTNHTSSSQNNPANQLLSTAFAFSNTNSTILGETNQDFNKTNVSEGMPEDELELDDKAQQNKQDKTDKADSTNIQKSNKPEKDVCNVSIEYYTGYDHSFYFLSKIESNDEFKVQWQFGDGLTSELANPKHIYEKPGQYAVTLVATNKRTNCKSESYKLVQVKKGMALSASILKGTAFADAEYASKTLVHLMDVKGNTIVQTTLTNNKGQYEFSEIGAGVYVVKVMPYKNYYSTYYGNSTNFEEASEVIVFEGDFKELSGYDVQMQTNTAYAGHIPGHDTSGSKVYVVVDQYNNPLAIINVGSDGKITGSSNLPAGNYNIIDKNTGMASGSIDVSSSGAMNMGSNNSAAGMSNNSGGTVYNQPNNRDIKLSPNPAKDVVNVKLSNSDQSEIYVSIINYSGALIKQFTIPAGSNATNVDISMLSSGNYYVIATQNGITTTSVLVKSADNSK